MGVVAAAVYLITVFFFIPFPFVRWMQNGTPHDKLLAFLSGLLSVCCAILLGFADDALDLRWRHKLLFPTLSSMPMLLVYYATGHSTSVVTPIQLQWLLGASVNIGPLYYLYMGMMVVFCTNAVNILAGVNGLEVGQSVVIAGSVALFNAVQLLRNVESQMWYHQLSLYFLLPFLATSIALLYFNWYPARVFVGDTYCYWSGMTLAVVCVLGHFSKTMALFLVPQVVNFLYSVPQLFHFVPCPRHRLPRYHAQSDTISMLMAEFKLADLSPLGRVSLRILRSIGLLHWLEYEKDGDTWVEVNNLTLLNLCLLWFGPMPERRLTVILLSLQLFCSALAFFIRFYAARLVYSVVH